MSPVIHDESVLKAVKDLAPGLTERSREIEVERTLPTDLVAQLRDARVFGLMTPASLGGLEAEPSTIVSVIEELTRADASAGWTAMIGQGAGYLAWLDRDVAKGIVEDNPRPVILGSMMPMGTAVPGEAGAPVRVTGRWPYTSGAGIADLIFGAFITAVNGAANNGPPPMRFALFPAPSVRVHDTWRVAGLRGTGSHDIEVFGLEVPTERTFDPFGPAREDGPLYRLPYMTFLMTAMAGFPLGAARRIVDEYFAVARVKQTTERKLLAETPMAQADLARCETLVRAARASVFDALRVVWEEARNGVPTLRARALLTGAVQHAMRAAVEVADAALRACGASQLYDKAPLQRYFRDVQAAAQHIAFGLDAQRRVGATLLGLDTPAAFV